MNMRGILIPICMVLLVWATAACGKTETSGEEQAPRAASSESGVPTLIDLGADKCVPCKMMAPILEELKEEYAGRMEVQFIDVWKNRDKAAEYGMQMIPTQIFYDEDGNELFRRSGFIGKEDILAKWRELGYDFKK